MTVNLANQIVSCCCCSCNATQHLRFALHTRCTDRHVLTCTAARRRRQQPSGMHHSSLSVVYHVAVPLLPSHTAVAAAAPASAAQAFPSSANNVSGSDTMHASRYSQKKSSPSFTPGRLQRYFISRTMEVAATGPTAPPLLRPEELELLLKVTIPTDPTLPTPLLLHSFPCSPLATLGRLKAKHQYRPLPPPAQMATATAKACTSLCCHGT